MTSRSFRRSRRRQRQSRRGGNTALANAVVPVGLTLWQQHLKKRNGKKNFQTMRKFAKQFTPRN